MNIFQSIKEVSELLASQKLSPLALTEQTLAQIAKQDSLLNSFITVDKTALRKAAAKATEEIADSGMKSPLHGIPIGIKDMIAVKDMPMTLGSKIFSHHMPREDAEVIKRLKAAGGLIIGKHNMDAFAYGVTGETSDFGPTKNPFAPDRTPGGSSSGSAAAVAAGMSFAAFASDTGGSLRIPAAYCGIVAMKPTYGSLPMEGVFPLAKSLDHIGPMTRTVLDNYLLYQVMQNNFTPKKLEKIDLEKLTIGIPREFYYEGVDPEILAHMEKIITLLQHQGAEIKEVQIKNLTDFYAAQHRIITKEAYQLHEKRLKETSKQDWPDEVYSRLTLGRFSRSDRQARKVQAILKARFLAELETVDILLTPAVPIFPKQLQTAENEDKLLIEEIPLRSDVFKLVSPSNLTGLPSLVMPSGRSAANLPIGIQLIGAPNTETQVYKAAYALEQQLII